MIVLPVQTNAREELVDITAKVADIVRTSGVEQGICLVFSAHTTAGITINEHADPAVADDFLAALAAVTPKGIAWTHAEGNSPAHLKASLVGSSATIPIAEGNLALGTWQGIFLCEFDGPRVRRVHVQVVTRDA